MNVIQKELEQIGNQYADARRTKLVDSFDDIVIEEEAPVADEATVLITRAGFVKRFARRNSEKALEGMETPRARFEVMTDEKLLFSQTPAIATPWAWRRFPSAVRAIAGCRWVACWRAWKRTSASSMRLRRAATGRGRSC